MIGFQHIYTLSNKFHNKSDSRPLNFQCCNDFKPKWAQFPSVHWCRALALHFLISPRLRLRFEIPPQLRPVTFSIVFSFFFFSFSLAFCAISILIFNFLSLRVSSVGISIELFARRWRKAFRKCFPKRPPPPSPTTFFSPATNFRSQFQFGELGSWLRLSVSTCILWRAEN